MSNNTTALLSTTVEHVCKLLGENELPEDVHVRTSSVNGKTGRCLFDFKNLDPDSVAIAAVCKAGQPTGQFYVIPASECPKILLVKPGSRDSKWYDFFCQRKQVLEMVKRNRTYINQKTTKKWSKLSV